MRTVKEWLESLAGTNSSTEEDSAKMQGLLRRVGFPNAVVVIGVVYLEGYGPPDSIHSVAKSLLEIIEKEKQTNVSLPQTG